MQKIMQNSHVHSCCLVVVSLCESSSGQTDVWCLPSASAQKRNIVVLPNPLPLLSSTSKQSCRNCPTNGFPYSASLISISYWVRVANVLLWYRSQWWLLCLHLIFLSSSSGFILFQTEISFLLLLHFLLSTGCPLISLATSFSARSLKFGGSLHMVRAVPLISSPSLGDLTWFCSFYFPYSLSVYSDIPVHSSTLRI